MGAKPRGEIIRTLSPALFNPTTQSIRVNSKLQVDDKSYPHIFVAGDVADTPDLKMAYKASLHTPVVASNIIALIKNQAPTAEYKPVTQEMMVLPMGKLGGVSYLAFFGGSNSDYAIYSYLGFTIGNWATKMLKGNGLFIDKARKSVGY